MTAFNTLEEIVYDDSVIKADEIKFKQSAYKRIKENKNVSRGGYTNLTAVTFRNEGDRHNLTILHINDTVIYVESGYSLNA